MPTRRLLLSVATLAVMAAGTPVVPASAATPVATLAGRPVAVVKGGSETAESMMARQARNTPSMPSAATAPRLQPGRANLPGNPLSAGIRPTLSPQKAITGGPKIPAQTTSTQFLGAQLSDSGFLPPDSMGTVGPTQFVVAVNGRIRTFNKATGVADGILDTTFDSFFTLVRSGSSTSDPRIRYDRLSSRWFVTMVNTATPSNRVLVAFSDTSNITNTTQFSEVFVDVGALHSGCIWDYDALGIDVNALYIGGNIFCGAGPNPTFTQTDGLVMSKPNLLAGAATAADFGLAGSGANCPPGPDNGPYTPQGVDNVDPAATAGYFAGVSVCNFGELDFVRINSPASGAPSATRLPPLIVAQTQFPIPVPALGSGTRKLDALDDRLYMAQMRNGHLWTAHNVGVDVTGTSPMTLGGVDRDATRWYEVANLGSAPSLVQSGSIFDNAASTPGSAWMPSINVSGQGHAALGLNLAGPAERPDAATVGRFAGDAAGTLRDLAVYQASGFSYNPTESSPPGDPHRWGDYSYTSVDPNDDMTMWTIQEFANATNSWGVDAVKLVAPPPATPTTTDGTVIFTNQCSQLVTVTGTSTNGSGFFDPGPGFANRLQASVSGGVTVNKVTFVDPTHVTLDISTQGTATGLKNLTITNPDGQAVTVNNFLNVTGASSGLDAQRAVSLNQYSLSNSNGITWQEIDPALRIGCTPVANQYAILGANSDLWTGSAGFNQDLAIFVSDNGGADTLLAWKESGGFAGTSSPNAAFVQTRFLMQATHAYIFKLKWKTNKNAPGAFIAAGAGVPGSFSPTSLVAEIFPNGVTPAFAVSNQQYSLANSNGSTWMPIDDANLSITITNPSANSTAVLGANSDLWTGFAGFNQDIGIFVTDNAGPDTLVAWKESGGFAGTSSPNAAFVKATYLLNPDSSPHTYVFHLKWKTNKNAAGTFIAAGAGTAGNFSPTSLVIQTIAAGSNPFTAFTNQQYSLSNSNGSTWTLVDPALNVTVAPGAHTGSILGANADLWTGSAGFNQDIAIFVSDNGGGDQLVAWKESGGFAGTSSPNAAFAQATYTMTSGHTYVFKLKWKTNKNAPGTFIAAGAGVSGNFSPIRLTVELTN
jgi:hypothetical protein